jgi:phospholipase/carboxylesterase
MGPLFTTELFQNEWIAASARVPRAKQKLMIVLHGRGDSRASFRSIKHELGLTHMNYLLLDAPRKFMDGFSWYSLEPNHHQGVRSARAQLTKLVVELNAAGWKSEDIFWLGHSQGCLVACDLVLNHPHAFGGLVGVSGYLWFFRGWKKQLNQTGALKTPWLLTHGVRDRIIRPSEIREDIKELVKGRVPVLYREFFKGHDFDFEHEVPFIRSWLRRAPSVNLRETSLT